MMHQTHYIVEQDKYPGVFLRRTNTIPPCQEVGNNPGGPVSFGCRRNDAINPPGQSPALIIREINLHAVCESGESVKSQIFIS